MTNGDKTLTAGLHGGAGVNSLTGDFLNQYGLSFDCRKDFLASMDRLQGIPVDIFLGNHVEHNHTAEKYSLLLEGKQDAFVDPTGWGEFLEIAKERLYLLLEKESSR